MKSKKALTEGIRRLTAFALASVGAFSLFSSCTMRETVSETKITLYEAALVPAIMDKTIESTARIEFPAEETPSLTSESLEWIELYENTHGAGSASEVILNEKEISIFSRDIAEKSPACTDMRNPYHSISEDKLRAMLGKYAVPQGEYYDKTGRLITREEITEIMSNIAADDIQEKNSTVKAVITERCSLKSLPTELDFFARGDTYYSAIQESELIPSFPVLKLHESKDGKFWFVQSYYYIGWIPASCAAVCSDDEYRFYANPDRYVTVIEPYTMIGDVRYDMGAFLPYVGENDTSFTVRLPKRGEGGKLYFTEETVNRDAAVYGRLPYTTEYFYSQAFKYIGTEYGWGGAGGGVDCSGFVCSVFRSFGIYLPRNTGDQRLASGEYHNLDGYSKHDVIEVFASLRYPAAIHRPGHVMLFLGLKDGVPHIIHAPTGGEKVSAAALTYTDNLQSVSEIVPWSEEMPVSE